MQASFATVVAFYIVMSLMASTVFGDNVLQPVTLNWREYNANASFSIPPGANSTGDDLAQHRIARPKEWWVFAIQLIVLCFPIIDQISVSPARAYDYTPLTCRAVHVHCSAFLFECWDE